MAGSNAPANGPFVDRFEPSVVFRARRLPRSQSATPAVVRTRITADRGMQNRPPKIYRGNRKRVTRIKLHGNQTWELWVLIAWALFLIVVVIPLLIRNSR